MEKPGRSQLQLPADSPQCVQLRFGSFQRKKLARLACSRLVTLPSRPVTVTPSNMAFILSSRAEEERVTALFDAP